MKQSKQITVTFIRKKIGNWIISLTQWKKWNIKALSKNVDYFIHIISTVLEKLLQLTKEQVDR